MPRWRKRKTPATHERGGSGDSQSKVWSRGADAISGTEARLDLTEERRGEWIRIYMHLSKVVGN